MPADSGNSQPDSVPGQPSRRLSFSYDIIGNSFSSREPTARMAIARDLRDLPDDYEDEEEAIDSTESGISRSMPTPAPLNRGSSYHARSIIALGPRSTLIPALQVPEGDSSDQQMNDWEREHLRKDERNLLRDNSWLPPKDPNRAQSDDGLGGVIRRVKSIGDSSAARAVSRRFKFSETSSTLRDPQSPAFGAAPDSTDSGPPSESSPLLSKKRSGRPDSPTAEEVFKKWDEAIAAGRIQTTWKREAKTLAGYSYPLIATFLLQYSLTVASIFTVGHIGKRELGAVSLASMTSNITGYAIFQGLSTSLDTLCAQAYGSGRKKLVGLQMQRMVYFLWVCTIPIGIVWLSSTAILEKIVPDYETARLAGIYLKVLLVGAPGYAAFESGKRFMQAQGLFGATLWVLLICAPLNAFMNWLFVWHFGWGFIGAPIAVAVTDNLLPICLVLYVRFIDGGACWGGLTSRAFQNWGPMIRLALPGLLMVEAEFLAFEILTLAASYFGPAHLAAQSVLATITSITFQIPFPISIAASTRIANLIGATLVGPAKTSAKVALVAASMVGIFNVILLSSLRNVIAKLFTNDEEVIALVGRVLPLCAAFQLFDALAANCNGILRGLGRQEIGGYTNLFCYYVVAMPVSFGAGFGLHWELLGLWAGPALALGLVAAIEAFFIFRTNWDKVVEAASARNEAA